MHVRNSVRMYITSLCIYELLDPVKRLAAFQKQSQSATGDVTLQSCGHHRQSSEHTHQRMTSMMYQ